MRDAGVLVVLEVESQDLLYNVSRAERLGIYREDSGFGRSELSVKVNAYRNALNISDSVCQLAELFIELRVIFAPRKLGYPVGKGGKCLAVKVSAHLRQSFVKGIYARYVELDLCYAREV